MKRKEVLAVTPAVNVLVAGACIVRPDHEVCMAGPKNIDVELERLLKEKNVSCLYIFQESELKAEAWGKLAELSQGGVKVELFTTNRYANSIPFKEAEGAGINLYSGNDIFEALGEAFPKEVKGNQLIKACKANNEDLIDFISYKKTRFFMSNISSDDLKEAMLVMHQFRSKPFSLKAISKNIAVAVSHFIEGDFPFLEGKSRAIQELKRDIVEVGRHDLNILLIGETGTGKEAAAFFLHDFSNRAGKPFVSINCAALSEELLRSELFGHVKGAFTGATSNKTGLVKIAQGGTIFLDELGDMSLSIQADLLRFLQTRRYRPLGSTEKEEKAEIRIIAAAQPDLKEKLKSGKFRPDLFYRVAELELYCPALREVPDDLIRVIRHLLFQIFYKQTRASYSGNNGGSGGSAERIDIRKEMHYYDKNIDLFKAYSWPGNVRELFNLVKLHAYLKKDVAQSLRPEYARQEGSILEALNQFVAKKPDILPVSEFMTSYIKSVRENWPELPQKKIAKKLGMSENTLKKYLNK
jgi:transcriptional regulator with PAS, ATPase and Fis domain